MKYFLIVLVTLGLLCGTAQAGNVKFAWDAHLGDDVAGYRLFQRDSQDPYDYTAPVAEIPIGTETCLVEDVGPGNWVWTLRAFDTSGNESMDSNECSLDTLPPGPVTGFG